MSAPDRPHCPICGCYIINRDSGVWRCSACGTEGDNGLPESFVRSVVGKS